MKLEELVRRVCDLADPPSYEEKNPTCSFPRCDEGSSCELGDDLVRLFREASVPEIKIEHAPECPTAREYAPCSCDFMTRLKLFLEGTIMTEELEDGPSRLARFEKQATGAKERIVEAALLVDGQILSLPPPARHSDVGRRFGLDVRDGMTYAQGFVTSSGRYVDRGTAYVVARDAGQLEGRTKTGGADSKVLYSEDLW